MFKKSTEQLVAEKPSLEEFKKIPKTPVHLVADNIRSLDNVGLLFRLSDAFRLEKIYLCGITGYPAGQTGDTRPPHMIERQDRRIGKTAIRNVSYMNWEYKDDAAEVVRERKKAGDLIVVLEQTDCSLDYRTAAYRLPLTLVVGHERQGVSDGVLASADQAIEIPMLGMGNSHNVAVATAIILAHIIPRTV